MSAPSPRAIEAAAEVLAEALYRGRAAWEREAAEVKRMCVEDLLPLAERALVAAERAS